MARRRNERGVVLPTSAMFLSFVVVAAAAIVFLLTARPQQAPEAAVPVAQPTATPTATVQPTLKPKARPKPPVNKAQTLVVVFNNSNVKGLAGSTSARAQEAGWNVVGSDNWYGTIGTSTVYHPPRMQAAAKLLAKDLGIGRVKTAIEPMQFDRLTVVLTGDYRAG